MKSWKLSRLYNTIPCQLCILYNALLAALVDVCGANYARAIGTYGSKERPASRPPAGLYLYFCSSFISDCYNDIVFNFWSSCI